ncbi:MAG: hypothetical protein H0T91_03265 [Propionibacteriaceae bacterium]|nr:hypothetical protein [Propionibacteriaceae bacterium]
MKTRRRSPGQLGFIGFAAIVAIALLLGLPVSIRHNAPLGVSRTIDSGRGIAVRGGYVTPNYDGFDRLNVDLRVYDDEPFYDFTVHVRPAGPDVPDVRTIALRVSRNQVWHEKGAFSNAYLAVRFPEIADSAGQRFYVWIEGGPRNRDDIWTLWRIKSYSTVPAWEVVKAWVETPPAPLGRWPGGVLVVLLMGSTAATMVWLAGALILANSTKRPERSA